MIVGVARVTLTLPAAHSLKEKRAVLKSLLARLQNRFNVSAAEVEANDVWGTAVIGITCASTSARHADEMLASAMRFIEQNGADYYVTDVETETLAAL
jgi:uncharacterized protein YlxP (DUF503 family)